MFARDSSKKLNIKNIVTYSVYDDKKYMLKGNAFKPLKSFAYNTLNFITTYVSTKDIISTKVYISRTIPEEDILDIIDIKAYEELGLDSSCNYIISSSEIYHEGKEREFHIFAIEPEVLDNYYYVVKEKTKFIDLIIPAPLLFKSLYTHQIIPNSDVQSFVYFTTKDAFITFYKNGEYLYTKSIEYSLERIYEKYCEIIGEKVDDEEFFSLLISEKLNTTKTKYSEHLMEIFRDVFIAINDVIISTKRTFKLETIDHLYIGSSLGTIIGLDEYSQNYLGLNSSEFNFKYLIKTNERYTDQLQYLMVLNALDYLDDDHGQINLTIYPRPPSFTNRASGQFIIAIFMAISLSLAYPLYYLFASYNNDTKNFILKKQNKKLIVKNNKYKGILGKKKEAIKNLNQRTDKLTNKYNLKIKMLTAIYNKKVNYRLKSEIFYNLANELHQYDVNVDNIYSKEDSIYVSMVGSDENKLTKFIKYISYKYFNDIRKIDIEKIYKDSETARYKGLLKVELR